MSRSRSRPKRFERRLNEYWRCSVNTLVSEELLVSCAETALEVMFFTASVAPAESFEQMPRDCVRARVDFLSRPSGYLEAAIGRDTARHLAANLAGIELHELA